MKWVAGIIVAGAVTLVAALAEPTLAAPTAPQLAAGHPTQIPLEAFAAQDVVGGAVLSPDGDRIALRVVVNGVVNLAVIDAATKAPIFRVSFDEDNELVWFAWAGNQRVLVSLLHKAMVLRDEVRITRLNVLDVAARAFNFVGKPVEGSDGDNVVYIDPAGQHVLLAIQRTVFDFPSVWRFNLSPGETNKGVEIQNAKRDVWEWAADNAGTIRLGVEYAAFDNIKLWYRSGPDDDLRMIGKIREADRPDRQWDLAQLVAGSDEGYAYYRDNGRISLRKFNFATRTPGNLVFGNSDWDVEAGEFDVDGKLIAAHYADDQDRVEWFDPAMKAIHARLERALPGERVRIISRAQNGSRMLVIGGSESNPGTIYIYTAKDRTLDAYAAVRAAIDPATLASPKPITYHARDKTTIRAYLTLPPGRQAKNLPLIILPHGGPYGVRDKLQYDDEVQLLANRGYAVLQPNYRGSGGYGEPFRKLGDGQIGRAMQDDLDDAMDWAVAEGIADRARVCVVGSSYGGYAALWAVIRNPDRYRCAASLAGVTEWSSQLRYDRDFLTRTERKRFIATVRGEDQSYDLDLVSPAKQVKRLTRPVLLAHGDKDSRVPFSQFKSMRDAAHRANVPIETLVLPKAGHGFDDPKDEQRWYAALESFLARHNPADAPAMAESRTPPVP